MKKLINLKEIMIILLSVTLIAISTTAFASNPSLVLGDNTSTISGSEYDNAQTVPTDNNTTNNTNNTTNNINTSTNNSANNVKTYNTNNTSDLPQTGIEDYNIGILLIICVASAIFAYKKVNDYRNI